MLQKAASAAADFENPCAIFQTRGHAVEFGKNLARGCHVQAADGIANGFGERRAASLERNGGTSSKGLPAELEILRHEGGAEPDVTR